MLGRLRAEEALLTAERMAVGTGALKPGVAKDIQRGWMRDAEVRRRQRAKRAGPADLKALGIGFRPKAKAATATPTP